MAQFLAESNVLDSFVDVGGMEQFWRQWYLHGFVDLGVGKVKFIKGRAGSGKTHFLRHLGIVSQTDHYAVVSIDANETRLVAIDELYRAISSRVAWEDLIDLCAHSLITDVLGYLDFNLSVPEFMQWAVQTHGRSQAILTTDIRDETDKWIRSLDLHYEWIHPIRSLILRRITGESGNEDAVYRWLQGHKLSSHERRDIGVAAAIDRRNARAMLLSLAVFVHAAAHRGLIVLIDNADVMARGVRTEGIPYYTRGSRDQAYEMLRELIDESHQSAYLFFVIAGNPDLYENQKTGYPSYPALWARIQSEIVTTQLNRFADFMDLDALWHSNRDDQARLFDTWRNMAQHVQLEPTTLDITDTLPVVELDSVRRTVVKALMDNRGGMDHDV
jgi:hypothetical protein